MKSEVVCMKILTLGLVVLLLFSAGCGGGDSGLEKEQDGGRDSGAPADIRSQDSGTDTRIANDLAAPELKTGDDTLEDVGLPDLIEPDTLSPDVEEPDTSFPDTQDPDTQLLDLAQEDTEPADCGPLDLCYQANCSDIQDTDSPDGLRCIYQNCPTQFETCFGSFGQGNCSGIFGCVQTCNGQGDQCYLDCMLAGTMDENLKFLDLNECMMNSCSQLLDDASGIVIQDCILANCQASYLVCVPLGTGSCKDILKCTQNCTTDQCSQDCMTSGSLDANLEFMELGMCMTDHCPEAFEDPMANMGCFIGDCNDPLTSCCGGSLMSCL